MYDANPQVLLLTTHSSACTQTPRIPIVVVARKKYLSKDLRQVNVSCSCTFVLLGYDRVQRFLQRGLEPLRTVENARVRTGRSMRLENLLVVTG
jgi:hypothetical protein